MSQLSKIRSMTEDSRMGIYMMKIVEMVLVNLQRSCNARANVSHVGWEELCETKIRDLGCEVFIKENIACFNVSMNNMWLDFLVKKRKPSCDANANFRPCFPAKRNATVTST